MVCLICGQTEIVGGLTSVKFERGEFRLIVNNVPAHGCASCGEAYVEDEIAEKLLRDAEEMFQTGLREHVMEYAEQQRNQRLQE